MNRTKKNRTYADFLRTAFPWKARIEWFGRGGIVTLDDNRRAEIDPAKLDNYGQQTEGLEVKIVDKKGGKITRRSFRYDDFMVERADNRTDYQPLNDRCFMVAENIGLDWYIAIPAQPQDFSEAVEHFIDLYR